MANVNELDKKIQKLEDEIKSLKEERAKLEDEKSNLEKRPAIVEEYKAKKDELSKEYKAQKEALSKLLNEKNPDNVKAAQPKIEKLKKEVAALEKETLAAEKETLAAEKEIPAADKIEKLKKEIAALTKQIEDKEKELNSLRKLAARVGQTLYHWCYGPVKVLDVAMKDKDTFIHCQILDPAGVREPKAVAWLNNPPYEPYKRWMPDALGVWLFDEAEKVVYSPRFDPAQQHKFYD